MNEEMLKTIAQQAQAVVQALQVTGILAVDLRKALQPAVDQATILFTEAALSAKAHAEAAGLHPDDALKLAVASLSSAQGSALSIANAMKESKG